MHDYKNFLVDPYFGDMKAFIFNCKVLEVKYVPVVTAGVA